MALFLTYLVSFIFLCSLAGGQSCEERCGDNLNPNEPCQCNDQCVEFGDCCDDYEELCLGGTCAGRCGDNLDPNEPCQCNEECTKFGDCCDDYVELCLSSTSCVDRCGEDYNPENPCHCNDECSNYGNCCDDYDDECGSSSSGVTDDELRAIGETLWLKDSNRMPDSGYTIDENGPQFFTYVDESHFDKAETFNLFLTLLDNYNPNVGEEEGSCSICDTEESKFLDAILKTTVMQETWQFLVAEGLASNTIEGFKDELHQYWFGDYSRKKGGSVDSSGFEHVMMGELDGSKVSGFHNWVKFYIEERDGNLDFENLPGNCEPDYVMASFDWYGKYKSGGSMFLAVSPELDLAMYTICFLARPNQVCTISFDGMDVSIQTYDMPNADFLAVGTAYSICN